MASVKKTPLIPIAAEEGKIIYEVGMDEVCVLIAQQGTEILKTIGIQDCMGVVLRGIVEGNPAIALSHITERNYNQLISFIDFSKKFAIKFTEGLISFREDKEEMIKNLKEQLETKGIRILLHKSRQLLETTGIRVVPREHYFINS